ncbi:hypothetical protein ATANTOWER_022697 [Ataeniobius toweri]|uniref:Uncharacterized protein n=1 Tax=Ataeniobius toweri TaxID=208326 RepID=A0ABU7B924_9TELE|nr:hypothetical protein [Ataeniobius toweri]
MYVYFYSQDEEGPLKGPSLPLLRLRLYPTLQVTMAQKMTMSHLPVSYVVPQGPRSFCPKKKEQLIQANRDEQLLKRASQATSRPGDDNEDKWHSPSEPDIEAQARGILQDLDLTPQNHGHR